MAVQQNRTTRSKRNLRRSHHRIAKPTLSEDVLSGEVHRRHHITEDGYYRGRRVVDTTSKLSDDE
ncbi:MAG: 50S ribosomal protein L32 [Gammaproteobacteria bacterium]|nr:50S ribosomal protein L32 [Gammaproteobacteria bacterium]MYD79468.1 50S ribosomal protein L32 [Gammaproteobacteria bacterium]